MHTDQQSGGLLAAARRYATFLLNSGKTRLELLGNEIEEEKQNILRMLFLVQSILLCIIAFMVVSVELVSVVFVEHRILALAIAALFFLGLAILLALLLKGTARRGHNAFAASISELEEDIRQMKAAMRDEQQNQ